MTSPSPSNITCSLLICLEVCHGAVPVAKRVISHHVVAAVIRFPGLVEVGEGRHYICQRAEVTMRRVILQKGTYFELTKHWWLSLNYFKKE